MPKSPRKKRLTEVERLKASGPHFLKTESPRKAPTKRNPGEIQKRTKAGVTKPTTAKARGRPKKTEEKLSRDEKTEQEAREFIAVDNKKKGITKSLTEMTWEGNQAKAAKTD